MHANVALKYGLSDKPKAAWKLPLVILLELAVYLLVCFTADKLLANWHLITLTKRLTFNYQYCLKNLYRGIYFIGFSTGYYFLITYNKEKQVREESERQRLNEIIQRQKAEQELAKAHTAFLKAQINPHFLFNTLDFIYHHVMEISPVAADAIIALAEMMRYAIDADKMGEFIFMGDEIDQVINLQYLNQIRKNEEVAFHLTFADEVRELHFIPLVLLTLAENIFKHGQFTNYDASLDVYMHNNLLVIESENMSSRQSRGRPNGTGLLNIGQRLKYAYGDAAQFGYEQDNEGHFKVKISVPVWLLHETASLSITSANTGKV